MATHASAEKRHRQSLKRRDKNRAERSSIRSAIKSTVSAAEGGDQQKASDEFRRTQKLVDKAVNHGLHHKNKAQRIISRLQTRLNSIQAQ